VRTSSDRHAGVAALYSACVPQWQRKGRGRCTEQGTNLCVPKTRSRCALQYVMYTNFFCVLSCLVCVQVALDLSQLTKFTGRDKPTVIT
jgi:hypothetical protein